MNHKRIYRLSALVLLISIIIFPNSFSNATVLGESEFPAEKEDSFVWETVNATESWYMEVEFVRFTVTDIYNETYNFQNHLFMNYTLEFYHNSIWYLPTDDGSYENAFYMAYNKTLGFLNWSEEGYYNGNLFLFPTPVNYTLIGEAVMTASVVFSNYSFNGTKLTLDYGNNTRIELTIDTSGISTSIERLTNNTTIYRWELRTEKIIVKVPFGHYFLPISITTTVFLIIIKKKKLKRTNNRKENIVV
ncbi:MAG: hypothetical protein HWN80_04875 [Candidatus Lokiarchaeota archaeon]|nr:hypothetical protein [Candidatus Lokiarchaeota archaeon]